MSTHTVLTAQTVEDCIIDQKWKNYTSEDHAIWRTLFERQLETLKAHVAEEYLKGLEALGIGHPASPLANHLTISLGVASILPTREAARFTLISMADEVLYRAKRSGRNRVSTLAESYQRTLSGFAAGQSHNRTPKPAELFSRGVHEATGTFGSRAVKRFWMSRTSAHRS